MKTLFALFLTLASVEAQERFVTLTVHSQQTTEKSFEISEFETATLVSAPRAFAPIGNTTPGRGLEVETDGVVFSVRLPSLVVTTANENDPLVNYFDPLVVRGPAKFRLFGTSGLLTFKVVPNAYPVGRTVLVPPGPGGAMVNLESSTNLVNWAASTNGIYTNLNTALFFRINMDKIDP